MSRIEDRAKALGIAYEVEVDPETPGSGYYCLCGCGEVTSYTNRRWSYFRAGHDQRLLGQLLRSCREGAVNINEAISVLEEILDTDRLANKLRTRWLRIGETMTPAQAWNRGRKVVCALAPHDGTEVAYEPRSKTDSRPWVLGILRYSGQEVRVCDARRV